MHLNNTFVFLLFLLLTIFLETILKIVSFQHYITPFSFGCYKLGISVYSYLFDGFSRNWIIHQLKKTFFKVIFFIFLALFSHQCNLIALSVFSNSNPWFCACFKGILSYHVYWKKVFFQTFQFSFFLLKMINHFEVVYHYLNSSFLSLSSLYLH